MGNLRWSIRFSDSLSLPLLPSSPLTLPLTLVIYFSLPLFLFVSFLFYLTRESIESIERYLLSLFPSLSLNSSKKLIDLASHHTLWNSKKGAAFAAQTLMKKSGVDLSVCETTLFLFFFHFFSFALLLIRPFISLPLFLFSLLPLS